MRPSNDRDWVPELARIPAVSFDGDRVTIRNFRRARHETTGRARVRWTDETFDLGTLRAADFLVEPFSSFEGAAHTLLTFGFADGRHLAISVELRREKGETFDPLAALFRRYELCYVVADERDVIHLRTNVRRHRVHLFPVRAGPEALRALLQGMLRRADALRESPEFYNTLTSTCTTNIVDHIESVAPGSVPLHWKVLLPGYAGELAHDLGFLDVDLPWPEAKERHRVDERARAAGPDEDFSAVLRAGRPRR